MTGLSRPPGRRRARFAAASGVLLVAAIVLGWRGGAAPAVDRAPALPPDWLLPTAAKRDVAADLAALTARHPWGAGAFRDAETAPPPPPASGAWKLAGIIARGAERFALIRVGPGPGAALEYRGVGEPLPDGSALVQIDRDSATTDGGPSATAVRRVYRLFNKQE